MEPLSLNSPINGQKPNKSPQNPTSQSNRVQSAVSNFFKTVCEGIAVLLSLPTGWFFIAKIVQHIQEPSLEKSTLEGEDRKEYAQYKKLANVFGKGSFDIITFRDWRTSLKNLRETLNSISKNFLRLIINFTFPNLSDNEKLPHIIMFSLMQEKELSAEDKEVLNDLCKKSDLELKELGNDPDFFEKFGDYLIPFYKKTI